MSPTNELRWHRRIDPATKREVKVLQQLWRQHHVPPGQTKAPQEWRDLPTEHEGNEKWD